MPKKAPDILESLDRKRKAETKTENDAKKRKPDISSGDVSQSRFSTLSLPQVLRFSEHYGQVLIGKKELIIKVANFIIVISIDVGGTTSSAVIDIVRRRLGPRTGGKVPLANIVLLRIPGDCFIPTKAALRIDAPAKVGETGPVLHGVWRCRGLWCRAGSH